MFSVNGSMLVLSFGGAGGGGGGGGGGICTSDPAAG